MCFVFVLLDYTAYTASQNIDYKVYDEMEKVCMPITYH